LIYHIQPGIVR